MRILRSILYTPGHRADLIEKAPDSGADGLCLVLEDSVPQARKAEAREVVGGSIARLGSRGQTVLVKVNPLGAGLEQDLEAILQPGLAGIIVPKLQSPDQIGLIESLLTGTSVETLLLVETPLAAVNAHQLALAGERCCSLICGTAAGGDMARGLGFQWSQNGLERLYLRSKVLMDARAAGCSLPLDGAYGRVRDLDGLVAEAAFARQLGYLGKLCLSPAQVAPVNAVFTPSPEELESAQRVVELFNQALAEGSAALMVEGGFVDYAMAQSAQAVLELARAIGSLTA
ncbi:MAG: HpcH/HpaI aldolase/citrate lyase family protein [Candidatus Dormibacteraceae bacterium]